MLRICEGCEILRTKEERVRKRGIGGARMFVRYIGVDVGDMKGPRDNKSAEQCVRRRVKNAYCSFDRASASGEATLPRVFSRGRAFVKVENNAVEVARG